MWFEQKNQLHQPNLDKFMEKLYDYLRQQLVTFILVTLFSLLIGLDVYKRQLYCFVDDDDSCLLVLLSTLIDKLIVFDLISGK